MEKNESFKMAIRKILGHHRITELHCGTVGLLNLRRITRVPRRGSECCLCSYCYGNALASMVYVNSTVIVIRQKRNINPPWLFSC